MVLSSVFETQKIKVGESRLQRTTTVLKNEDCQVENKLEIQVRVKEGDANVLTVLTALKPNGTFDLKLHPPGVHSHLYFAYTCVRDLFIGGVIYLAKKIIR
jgi:hypothetical protein